MVLLVVLGPLYISFVAQWWWWWWSRNMFVCVVKRLFTSFLYCCLREVASEKGSKQVVTYWAASYKCNESWLNELYLVSMVQMLMSLCRWSRLIVWVLELLSNLMYSLCNAFCKATINAADKNWTNGVTRRLDYNYLRSWI